MLLATTLAQLGIQAGDTVMVHSDAMAVAQFPGQASLDGMQAFWRNWQQYLGAEGHLLVPTFTYSLTRQECFDPSLTPSLVGMMTEAFRVMDGVERTRDPIFSMALWGPEASRLALQPCEDCFGPQSVFAWLAAQQGWITGFGCHPDRITFTHHVEQQAGVSYRYLKRFSGEMVDRGQRHACHCDYLVRDLNLRSEIDLSALVVRLQAKGVWRQALFGRIPVWAVRCEAFAREAQSLLVSEPYGLIREGRTG